MSGSFDNKFTGGNNVRTLCRGYKKNIPRTRETEEHPLMITMPVPDSHLLACRPARPAELQYVVDLTSATPQQCGAGRWTDERMSWQAEGTISFSPSSVVFFFNPAP